MTANLLDLHLPYLHAGVGVKKELKGDINRDWLG